MNEKRIIELTKKGDFKTYEEACECCQLHGLDKSIYHNCAHQIAGALLGARQSQDKITKHACADEAKAAIEKHFIKTPQSLRMIVSAIMNTKVI